jgi:hypothetical protein
MSEAGEEFLEIEARGDDFAVVHTDAHSQQSELVLSANAIVLLARLAPQQARQVYASKASGRTEFAPVLAAQVTKSEVRLEGYGDTIALVRLTDEFEAEYDFALTISDARSLGERLLDAADHLETAGTPTKQ